MRHIAVRLVSFLTLAAGLAAAPALASEGDISTRAFTNRPVPVFDRWGDGHAQIGALPGGIRVGVDGCSRLWCHVHAGRTQGWVFLYALSFGQGPNSIWWPPIERHGPYYPWRFLGEY
ncbi:MAG: hypothetical protein ACTHOR_17430 [Devosia sp.]|jgi:uncharacterized protein YraI